MAQPRIVINLSEEGEDGGRSSRQDRFLLAYTGADGNLRELAIVTEGAVFKGDSSCVEKPQAKKNLSESGHLSKVKDALVAAGDDRGGGGGGGGDPKAVLPLTLGHDEAVVSVKEALKGGKSFVVLATLRLQKVKEASGGLLFGVVQAAFARGEDSSRLRRDLSKADNETVKLKRLLDKAISDKRRVIHDMLARAALVVNSKKAMIANLQEPGSDDESGESNDGERGDGGAASPGASNAEDGDGEDEGPRRSAPHDPRVINSDGEHDGPPRPSCKVSIGKNKGKGKTPMTSESKPDDSVGATKRATGRSSTRGRGAIGVTRARVKVEGDHGGGDDDDDDDDRFGERGEGGSTLAVPWGTQEVSEEDLLRHVKPDPGSSTSRGSNANDKKNNNKNKRSRPLSPEPAAQKPTPSHANTDVLDSSDSEGGGEAERLIGGDNDSRSETRRAGGFDRFPRRRRKKKQQKVDQTKDSGDGGGRGDSGKGGEKAKAKAVPQKFMHPLDLSTDDEWDEDQLA